jgi:hypothetical protein
MRIFDALCFSIGVVGPPLLFATLFAILLSAGSYIFNNDRGSWNQSVVVTLLMSNFAATLGVFVGMTGNSFTSIALGAVSTLTTTYLTAITSNTTTNGNRIYTPALLCFYIVLPITVLYWRSYWAGGFDILIKANNAS